MCGISGIVGARGTAETGVLEGMLAAIRHRGPDGSGVYTDGRAALGHVRLSIIDIGGGRQPMHNEDETLWITFNGEIFNYVELMDDLIRRGHRFASRCDTEVILHAYEEYGEDCVQHFNGDWAFAIWDTRRQKLFLSRDRLGVRPVFYTQLADRFLFGSEIKALLAHPDVHREIDVLALDQLFTLWSTIPPRTIFKNIQELPPAHSLTWEGGCARIHRYWQPDYAVDAAPSSTGEYAEELLELLIDATRLRLRSDVPVGAYLSGGLDSSLTTALIKRFTDAPLRTFSVAFEDAEFDESRFQQEVTRRLNTDHQSISCSSADIGRIFPEVIRHTEKPVLRTAPAPLFLLSRLVRSENYKVVITGEGADEMLGGYDIFKEAKIRRFWAAVPGSKFRPLLLKRLYPYMPNLQAQSDAYRQAFFHVRAQDRTNPFFSHLPRWDLTSRLKLFLSNEVRRCIGDYDCTDDVAALLPAAYGDWDPFCQAQYLETTCLLPGYILSSQGDRVAMANAVEGRFPFLDHRVAEFAAKLPPRIKMRGLNEKDILKRVAADFVPDSIRQRPKQPYRAPDAKSFFGDATQPLQLDYVDELLSADRLSADGIFNPDAVGRLVHKARRGEIVGTKDNMALVGVLSTQLVIDQFIHGASRSPDAGQNAFGSQTNLVLSNTP